MVRLCLGAVAVGVGYGLADLAPPEGVVVVADRPADDVGAALPDTVGDEAVDDREFLAAETSVDGPAHPRQHIPRAEPANAGLVSWSWPQSWDFLPPRKHSITC